MSTSRNWSVQVHTFLEENPGKEDVLRYVLSSNLPETKDSEFAWKDYQAKNNNELVAILGNFINRILVLTHKFFEGRVPAMQESFLQESYIRNYHTAVSQLIDEQYVPAIESYRFRDALAAMMDVVRLGNKLLTDYEPWKIFKQDPETCGCVLRVCLESLIDIAVLCEPFLPFTADRICNTLGADKASLAFRFNEMKLETGAKTGEPVHFFSKMEDAEVDARVDALRQGKAVNANANQNNGASEQKPMISFDDFSKLDLRTGTIVHAEVIPKADKLLKLTVDLGFEKRTIVSGLAKHFHPETITGTRVLVLLNLEPRMLRGVESRGMILMAEDTAGKLYFVQAPELRDNGASVR